MTNKQDNQYFQRSTFLVFVVLKTYDVKSARLTSNHLYYFFYGEFLSQWLNVRLQIVSDSSLDIMKIRRWLLCQLWVVELILGDLVSKHTPTNKPTQNGHSGSLVHENGGTAKQTSPQPPGPFSPLPSPWTSISRYLEW